MAKQLVGKAPLSLVRTVDSGMEYVYAGKPVPRSADPADVRRLLDEGFLVEVASVEAAAEVEADRPDDPGLVNADQAGADRSGDPVEVARPPRAGAKELWVDFAVSQRGDGVDEDAARAQAEAMTKQELVDRFGA